MVTEYNIPCSVCGKPVIRKVYCGNTCKVKGFRLKNQVEKKTITNEANSYKGIEGVTKGYKKPVDIPKDVTKSYTPPENKIPDVTNSYKEPVKVKKCDVPFCKNEVVAEKKVIFNDGDGNQKIEFKNVCELHKGKI